MASQAAVLADVLSCTPARAAELLRESGGDLDGAIALGLANPASRAPQSPRSELRGLLDNTITQGQAERLLQRAGGSVAAAADLFFDQPSAAGPASAERASGGARGRRVGSEPITISDTPSQEGGDGEDEDSSEEESEGEEEESARRTGGRGRGRRSLSHASGRVRGRGRGRSRPSSAAGRGGAAGAGPSAAAAAAGGGGGGRGLVRSPNRRGPGQAQAGGVDPLLAAMFPGNGWLRLLGGMDAGMLGGDSDDMSEYTLDGSSSSSEESEDEQEAPDPHALPRVGPRPAGRLPDLNEAAAGWTERRMLGQLPPAPGNPAGAAAAAAAAAGGEAAAVSTLPPEALPLPDLRVDGRLFACHERDVPGMARPPRPLRFPLLLGSVELPLATLDKAQLAALLKGKSPGKAKPGKHWSELEWGGKSKLAHNYVLARYLFYRPNEAVLSPLSEAAAYGHTAASMEAQARLALYGRDPRASPLATVREDNTWVPELLHSLWVLETAGLVEVRLRLVAPPQQEEQQQDQQQQDASPGLPPPGDAEPGASSKPGRGRSTRRSQSREASAAPAAAAAAAASASAGAAGRSRGPTRGARVPAVAAANGGGNGKGKAKAKSRSPEPAAPAADLPRSVVVELFLLDTVQLQLGWDQEHGDLVDQQEKGGKKKGQGGGMQRATKYGTALCKVVAALLQHGRGLALGPDCDGLLNYGDVPAEEWAAVAGTPYQRPLFDVQRLLDSVSYHKPGLPTRHAPKGLLSAPKNYQLTGLQWMLNREAKGDALGRGQLHLHPAWLQLASADGQLLYLHRLRPSLISPNLYTAPVGGTCGGFLVDEMGLGKTLQTLMLVLTHPAPKGWAVPKLDGLTVSEDSEPVPIKCTLVVAPANLLGQWSEEIERHVAPGRLRWARYVPPGTNAVELMAIEQGVEEGGLQPTRRSRRVANAGSTVDLAKGTAVRPVMCLAPGGAQLAMHEADIVLISYEQLRDQLHVSAGQSSLLHQFGFWRVVLDEAQLVANSSSVAAVMASSLWRRHAWVVTGTPISHKTDEIKGLLEFLAAEPFYHSPAWRGLLQASYEAFGVGGLLSLRSLLRGVMLRRSKADVADELDLPPCTREDRVVKLSSVERLCYEQTKRAFCDAAYQLQQSQGAAAGADRNRKTGKVVGRALAAFTALRQSCCHPQIVRRTEDMLGKDRKSMRDIMGALVVKAYGEWDQAARRLVDAQLILAAVQGGVGSHPEASLRPVLDLIRANQAAAGSADIRHQATAVRTMFAEVSDEAIAELAAAGGSNGVLAAPASGTGAAQAGQQQQQQQQANGLAAADGGKGKAAVGAEQPLAQQQQQQQQQPQAGRKRPREEEAAEGEPAAGDTTDADRRMAEAMQAEEDAQRAQQAQQAEQDAALAQRAQQEEEQQGEAAAAAQGQAAADQPMTQEEKDAAARRRTWQKLELDALELYAHMLRQCAGGARPPARKGKGKGRGKGKKAAADSDDEDYSPAAKRPRVQSARWAGPHASLAFQRAQQAAAAAEEDSEEDSEGTAVEDLECSHCGSKETAGGQWRQHPGTGQRLCSKCRIWMQGHAGQLPPLSEDEEDEGMEGAQAGKEGTAGPSSSKGKAAAAAAGEKPDKALLQEQLEECVGALKALRDHLGLRTDDALADGRLMRRSRRRAGIDAEDEEAEVFIDVKEAEEQLLNAKLILRAYNEVLGRRDPGKSAKTAVAAAEKEAREAWHHLQHMINKEGGLVAAEKGKGKAAESEGGSGGAAGAPEQAADGAQQEDLNSCPICLDELSTRTITACGHHYCPPCIREVLAHGSRLCPICRTPLTEADLFDAVSEEEARLDAEMREAGRAANADYGAKVSALLAELSSMRAADPCAKAVVFSSWGRLLKLVGEALTANGLAHASLAGANPAQREAALHAFLHDPGCAVLTVVMSTAGGAAGLTLTVATTAFLLEPNLNPGLEAQAAARIYRLGQEKPTRVIRLIAEETVEAQVLEVQRRKLEAGDAGPNAPDAAGAAGAAGAAAGSAGAGPSSAAAEAAAPAVLADVDAGMLLQVYEAIK